MSEKRPRNYAFEALATDRVIAFHTAYARLTGSVAAGLLLSQMAYLHKITKDPDKWVYKRLPELQAETALSRAELESARKALRALGLIEEQRRGIPPMVYFRLDIDALEDALAEHQLSEIREIDSQPERTSSIRNPDQRSSRNQQNLPIPKTTLTETTQRSLGQANTENKTRRGKRDLEGKYSHLVQR